MNFFLSCISAPGPAASLQTIVIDDLEYPVITPEAIRSALRGMLAEYGLECNRSQDLSSEELAVQYQDFPDPGRFVDDFFFGYVVTDKKDVPKKKQKRTPLKRDSVLRNNMAVATTPYRHETILTRSTGSQTSELSREILYSAFQYPIAINLNDCDLDPKRPDRQSNVWFSHLLRALSELNGVGANQTRAYFEMAPVSVIARLTPRLASGYPLYPFNHEGRANQVLSSIIHGRLPGHEFSLGGEIVRCMKKSVVARLKETGVSLHKSTIPLFDSLSKSLTGRTLL